MSLAEELLADLEDAGNEDLDGDAMGNDLELEEVGGDYGPAAGAGGSNGGLGGEAMDVEEVGGSGVKVGLGPAGSCSVRVFAKLRDSRKLSEVMKNIEVQSKKDRRDEIHGPIDADPEYQLIVEANNITVEIDNEINVIHKFSRDIYSKRFPELESLVPTPLEYMKTAMTLENDILDRSKTSTELHSYLTPATLMVVSVTASTTQGLDLTPQELARVVEACKMAVELTDFKGRILVYVESRMSIIAPNLTTIVGSTTAAKLMGHAGGLTKLSSMPGCNVLLLGSQKKTLAGFSAVTTLPHTGYIYYCELIQRLPPDLRMKAARLVSSKATLAARVDAFHESKDGRIGDQIMSEIEKKLDRWLEPPPVKQVKALPAPIDPPAKKRGGRRYRKMKERLGLTDLRKTANRVHFGSINDDAYADVGIVLGAAGRSNSSGRVRIPVADAKTKARVSKAVAQKLQKQNQQVAASYGGSTTVKRHIAGTSSSIAFSTVQGLEIVNPQAAEKRAEDGNKYFSRTAGFLKVDKTS